MDGAIILIFSIPGCYDILHLIINSMTVFEIFIKDNAFLAVTEAMN